MRIALFTDTYLPTINGVARTIARLVDYAVELGHKVFLVGPRIGDHRVDHVVHHHRSPGIPLPVYPELQILRGIDTQGRRLLEAFEPEIVHVATEAPLGWSGRRWALKAGVPLVTSFHTNFPEYLAGYGFGLLEQPLWRFLRAFHRRARLTFCPSHATLTELQGRGFHPRLRIWRRGVDTERYSPERRNEDLRREIVGNAEQVLVYVGRLAPEKRLDVLMEAWPHLREASGQRVALVLVGDGPMAPKLRQRQMEGVYFTGYRTGVPLAEAYAIGDIFVFPSDTETFGNVVAEALATGLPVIAPDRGGVTDMVLPGVTGLLVPPRDARALADACLELISDPARRTRLGRGARELALRLTWPSILDGLLAGYEEAVRRHEPDAYAADLLAPSGATPS